MPDRTKEAQAAFDGLDRDIIALYAVYRPALVQGFAEFVFKQGSGAAVPAELNGRKTALAGKSWQHVGRTLYGEEFNTALAAIVAEKKATT